jgi:hypothetical protein
VAAQARNPLTMGKSYGMGRRDAKGRVTAHVVHPAIRFVSRLRENADGCLVWQGGKTAEGYGAFYPGSRQVGAHRYAYALAVGEIPDEMQVHHECGNRACCNPAHMRLVSRSAHAHEPGHIAHGRAAATHCKRGHPLSGENLRMARNPRKPDGPLWRQCRECARAARQRWRKR